MGPHHFPCLDFALCLDFSLGSSRPPSWPFGSTISILPPWWLPHLPGPLLIVFPVCGAICMSTETIESLSLKIDFLSERVEQLEEEVKSLKETRSAVSGYTFVEAFSSAGSQAGDQRPVATHDYNYLATTIPELPDEVVRACALLSGGKVGFRQRALRAWQAGHWARFVLEGKLEKPRPTTPIDLANCYYVVLRAPGFSSPVLCDKASDYRCVVGDFTGGTLSHGFPSKAEAWTYCKAAGFPLPATPYRWSSNSN